MMWFDENYHRASRVKNPAVAVVGSGGRLGEVLANALSKRHRVVALNRGDMDLSDGDSIRRVLGAIDYEYLFLTAALTDVDYCETHPREAYLINAEAAGIIADISADKHAHVTYLSTDMVFDGSSAVPYRETDAPLPISVYGHTKHDGERRVLEASGENLVARVSWLFGPSRPGFPEWIVRQATSCECPALPDDKFARPTYTVDLAEWLEALVFGNANAPASGVVHLCNAGTCSWREWGEVCLNLAKMGGMTNLAEKIRGIALEEVGAFVASRPLNSALHHGRFTELTGIRPRSWCEALRHFVIQSGQFRV
jgi:dTDP-4-dehydrorhamnose reductase